MSIPQTYRAFRRSADGSSLELVQEELPSLLHPEQVLIRIHAVSLNYRDIAMMTGNYAAVKDKGIPASDCAAEVIAMGSNVLTFNVGDRVAPIFDLSNVTGTEEEAAMRLGGDVDGVLREFAVFDQRELVRLPDHLSWEEAACITCAGTTAWTALNMPRTNGTALLQGTGGVSMFAILICLAAGIHPIIMSSSDDKLSIVCSLGKAGAVDTINYRIHPQWDQEVLRLTNGRGVDVVIENVGQTTLSRSLSSLAKRGTVSLVGFLGGHSVDQYPNTMTPLLAKQATMRGHIVGSKIDQQNLCDFLTEKNIRLDPIIDKTSFSFEESQAAFDYLYAAKHMGKIVIKISH
ncbi:NAD(P)-binding protein [Aspergillus sclerotioniger CBS 115572]|uniref:NAD(P)-binding protein n=1 Tax=Aspergillus sclerotioniger CBS 115572 TaxID=1450535 RepID=A0A317WC76_9EURO|nr:NAD(P)-binding protein [Aspergillus sclerotioniger CBS 115572]PWY83829.1 NAD(P)-binding protein [Aspergillus sclerotioniger CBS 115572]